MAIIPEIVDQHVEEAAFLWILRDDAVHEPHYNLHDLIELENRLEAHLDGLRVNGHAAWEVVKQQLGDIGEAGEVFAAGVLALESGQPDRIKPVLEIGTTELEISRGLISAFGWVPYDQIADQAKALLENQNPLARRVGIASLAIHRKLPSKLVKAALVDPDPLLCSRALRAVGEVGSTDLAGELKKSFEAEDVACRFWSAWSAALLSRNKQALSVLRQFVLENLPYAQQAIKMLMRAGDPGQSKEFLTSIQKEPKSHRLAAIGTGSLGDPEFIPWLLEVMLEDLVARVAGEAFSMITGVDLADENLETDEPEGFEGGPTEETEDENVDSDADENLPWPNAESVAKWWEQHKSDYKNGTRYLVGQPMSEQSLAKILREGMQRQRTAAAMELALRNPQQGLFEVRAPGLRQQQKLKQK